jgi:hypothetical protein
VKLGDKMKVMIASADGPLEAVVSEIAPVADAVSRTFQVKLDLPPAAGLRTGQFGRVSVPVAEVMLLLVPQSAVIKRGQMEMVFVVGDGKAALRLVKTGKTPTANPSKLTPLDLVVASILLGLAGHPAAARGGAADQGADDRRDGRDARRRPGGRGARHPADGETALGNPRRRIHLQHLRPARAWSSCASRSARPEAQPGEAQPETAARISTASRMGVTMPLIKPRRSTTCRSSR